MREDARTQQTKTLAHSPLIEFVSPDLQDALLHLCHSELRAKLRYLGNVSLSYVRLNEDAVSIAATLYLIILQ